MAGRQEEIDFLMVELHLVQGMTELHKKLNEISGLRLLDRKHPLIPEMIRRLIALLERLQHEINSKKREVTSKEKQQVLVSQWASLQSCIELLVKDEDNLDDVRVAADNVLKLAPANAKRK